MILTHRTFWTILGAGLLSPVYAFASDSASYQGYARVTKVTPVLSRSVTRVPVERCSWRRLPSRVRYYPQAGERRLTERRAKRCRTEYQSRVTEKTTGYEVTLNYNGESFVRRTQTHPGERMPVSVVVSPLHE